VSNGKVVVAYATPDQNSSSFGASMVRLLLADAKRENPRIHDGGDVAWIQSGPDVAFARNTLVGRFLTAPEWAEVDWLLFLDADIVFPTDLIEELLAQTEEEDRKIIGGLYIGGGRGSCYPCMYRIQDPAEHDGNAIVTITDWTPGSLVEVDACGAGCLLIHRDVLEHMLRVFGEDANAWFAYGAYKKIPFSEDWTFCMRAGQLGYSIHVDTAVALGHEKVFQLSEAFWRTGETGWDRRGAHVKTRLEKMQEEKAARLEVVETPGLILP
jgi:GT2 family glycosyltransferase